ncbi:MAG: hypothetical protein Q8K78_13755 [Planctomycetaceae bacterium]|nr:hypothetical protein [Planctomycetaceae bacterium]
MMRQLIMAAEVASKAEGFPTHFESKPLFRYSDPARGSIAASVWKLGGEGRPKALLAMELHRSMYQRPCVMYEYMSLTTTPFSVKAKAIDWSPESTLFEFKPIKDMRAPEKTAARRLIQMRELAHRFAASEVANKEHCELRLLPQPIDRYKPFNRDLADGAIFLFAFGTNPEVVLILETDGTDWTYSAGRMTGAQSVELTLDGKTAWVGAPLQGGQKSPYTGSVAAVVIPGYTADGKELTE